MNKRTARCPKCNHLLMDQDKKCRHCNAAGKRKIVSIAALIAVALVVFVNLPRSPLTDAQKAVDSKGTDRDRYIQELSLGEQVQPVELIDLKESKQARRKLVDAKYQATLNGDEQILATAAHLAQQIQQQHEAQFVSIVIYQSDTQDMPLLELEYAEDGKGKSGKQSGTYFSEIWYTY
ncbi:hypothetical protein [Vibrio stylophorae]|nr:hypothetical protein [Vibrio stylophorae]